MIRFLNVSHCNRDETRRTSVLEGVSVVFPPNRRVALLGSNGAGKTTILRLVSKALKPDKGEIISSGKVSWPIGFTGSFSPDMSAADNVRFIARLYDRDARALVDFVESFADIGDAFWSPWRTYSSGQRARVSMGAAMGVPFGTYLVDEATSVGDTAFRDKAEAYLKDRLSKAGAVIVSHSNETLRSLCDMAALLDKGSITLYEDLEEGVAAHERRMKRP